jgi:beclin 1
MHCQKCRTPLKLDGSLEQLNPAAFKLLVDSSGTPTPQKLPRSQKPLPSYQRERLEEYDRAAQSARQPIIKRSVPSNRLSHASKDNPNMSFIMLSESQVVQARDAGHDALPTRPKSQKKDNKSLKDTKHEAPPLKDRMDAAHRIFEILSARSDVDHPICVECTELLVDDLQKRLNSTTKERDAYVEFLRQANADIPSEEEIRQADKELQQAQKKEQVALADLEKLEAEKAALEKDILILDSQAQELDGEEDKFWAERNAFAVELAAFQSERDRINTQYDHDSRQLQRLQRANVYNDTFSIGYDGYFGTINGLRLGRLPDRAVEWSEINAAWGHTCLLVATVADKLDFRFHGHELRPMGSTSKVIEYLPKKSSASRSNDNSMSDRTRVHELYSSGEYAISIGLFNRKFDNAMVAFLECLRQLIQHAQKTHVTGPDGQPVVCPEIPYVIDKDKIGDVSIKLGGFNQEESWTKACKTMLICCKYLLAHASNVNELGRRS